MTRTLKDGTRTNRYTLRAIMSFLEVLAQLDPAVLTEVWKKSQDSSFQFSPRALNVLMRSHLFEDDGTLNPSLLPVTAVAV